MTGGFSLDPPLPRLYLTATPAMYSECVRSRQGPHPSFPVFSSCMRPRCGTICNPKEMLARSFSGFHDYVRNYFLRSLSITRALESLERGEARRDVQS